MDIASPEAPQETGLSGPCALVVDDDPDCLKVTCELLQRAGIPSRTAGSIRDAFAEASKPDIGLVVTDMCMPGGNGMQLVEQLAKARPELEVIIFSGYATEATREKARELGCFRVVDKPGSDQLLSAVRAAAGSNRLERLAAEGRPVRRPKAGRVLLADDHGESLEMMRGALEDRGFVVTAAHDGAGALRLFNRGEFDLVLLDVNMPGVGGLEATRAIRGKDSTVAILLVSGEASSREVFGALASGADSMLAKPVNILELGKKAVEFAVLTHRRPRGRRREERRRRRSAPEKAAHWLQSRRTAGSRRRAGLLALIVLLSIVGGIAIVSAGDWAFNAGRWTKGVIGLFQGRLDRIEGYLQRDEQRELDRLRREREAPPPPPAPGGS